MYHFGVVFIAAAETRNRPPERFVAERRHRRKQKFHIVRPILKQNAGLCYRRNFDTRNILDDTRYTLGIKIPFPSFTSEYPIEVEPSIAFTLMLRKKRGLQTQNEIAKKLNISYQQYQQLENPKKANPTLKTIAKLQKIFNYRFVNF